MMIFNKKGSVIIEAAFVYPLLILSIISVMCILMFLFRTTDSDSKLYLKTVQGAGEYSECYTISPEVTGFELKKKTSKVYSEYSLKSMNYGILKSSGKKENESESYILNEKRHIRVVDRVKD